MAVWRLMTAADMDEVVRIADAVHADLPESRAVLAERLALFPAGCLITDGGYVIAHPARFAAVPALDTLLGERPAAADVMHLHDVALLPERQGRGLGAAAVARIATVAARYGLRRMTLVAVHGTPAYWGRRGFGETGLTPPGLASYGPGARYLARCVVT